MCQKSLYVVPMQLFVHSINQSIKQVKENTRLCRDFLSDQDNQLYMDFLSAEQAAAQLQSQLEQIIRDLDNSEGSRRSLQTMITYFD